MHLAVETTTCMGIHVIRAILQPHVIVYTVTGVIIYASTVKNMQLRQTYINQWTLNVGLTFS